MVLFLFTILFGLINFSLTGCPWRIELLHRGSEKEDLKETLEEELILGRATISSVKLQPCVFELCKFYSQCVCRGFSHRAAALQRYSSAQQLNYSQLVIKQAFE